MPAMRSATCAGFRSCDFLASAARAVGVWTCALPPPSRAGYHSPVTIHGTRSKLRPMPSQLAPATLEGWYALHQMFSMDWASVRAWTERAFAAEAEALFGRLAAGAGEGWSEPVRLVGAGGADWMFIHFRPTLEELAEVQRQVATSALAAHLTLTYEYLSVTEAGLYHATADAAKAFDPGSEEFRE